MKSTFPDILSWRNFMVSFRLAASPRNGGGGGGSDGSCANAHAINRSRGSSPPGSSRRAGGSSPRSGLTADEMSLPYSPVPKSSPSGTRLYCRGGHFGSGSAPARSRTPQGRFPPARLLHPGRNTRCNNAGPAEPAEAAGSVKPKTFWVSGKDTFKHKEQIKKLGGRYDGTRKAWEVLDTPENRVAIERISKRLDMQPPVLPEGAHILYSDAHRGDIVEDKYGQRHRVDSS